MNNTIRRLLRGLTTKGWVEQASEDNENYTQWSEGPVTVGLRDGHVSAISPSGVVVALVDVGPSGTENGFDLKKRASDEGISFTVNGQKAGTLRQHQHGLIRSKRVVTIELDTSSLPADVGQRLAVLEGAFFRARGIGGFGSLENDQGYLVRSGLGQPKLNGDIGMEVILLHLLVSGPLNDLVVT